MWPLLALSVLTLAILIDRGIAFSTLRLATAAEEAALIAASRAGNRAAADEAAKAAPALIPLIDAAFEPVLPEERERSAAIAIEEVVRGLDSRLGLLAVSGRVAPLLGLLGTVLGMIQTFSRLATAHGAIDMTLLADGIWQALLTTAAGLFIAIPAVAAHQAFLRREDRVAFILGRLANRMLARPAPADAPR
ncbi:MotA/TolQ/ExbB proton channel family protein [Oleispirillum naphthae]|uniref:MotA/TolQ/ExbB proton channel family protein n=1 Tax=Oleispirillum naphthae TaxID=2838853 RepID=UPI0030822754